MNLEVILAKIAPIADCSIRVYIDLLRLKSDPAKTGPAGPAPTPLTISLMGQIFSSLLLQLHLLPCSVFDDASLKGFSACVLQILHDLIDEAVFGFLEALVHQLVILMLEIELIKHGFFS